MSPAPKKRRGERFVSHPGEVVIVEPGEEPRRPARAGPGLELRELRHRRNITQVELAELLGVDQAQISRLESRGDPRLSTVLEYLRGLGVKDVELELTFHDGTQANVPIGGKK